MHVNTINKLSIVVPLYNEAKRICRTLPLIERELARLEKDLSIQCELLLVNDGSTDNTAGIVRASAGFPRTRLISLPQNSGKGGALQRGFSEAHGDFILFMDADLSTPLEFVGKFLDKIDNDHSIFIGSRKMKRGLMKVKQPFLRRKLGQGFTLLCNILLGTSVSDFTCGFKLFPMEAGKRIFRNLTITRWGFDAEVIYLARRFGYTICEMPVAWFNDADSKVKLSRDVLGSLRDVIKIKFNSLQNVYKK